MRLESKSSQMMSLILLALFVLTAVLSGICLTRLANLLRTGATVHPAIVNGLDRLAFSGDTPNSEVRPAFEFLIFRDYRRLGSQQVARWGDATLATFVIAAVIAALGLAASWMR
jgi:hypothetical protein